MSAGKIALMAVLAGFLGLGISIVGQQWSSREGSGELRGSSGRDSDDVLDRLPEFRLPDLNGEEVTSNRWAGKVLVLNFWATWCPPCLRELPLFDEMQQTHSGDALQFVGIALDNKEDVEEFLAGHPVGIPILLGDTESIEISRRLGNRLQGLPFTAIFDHEGRLVYGRTGEMTRTSLSEHLNALLSKDKNAKTRAN